MRECVWYADASSAICCLGRCALLQALSTALLGSLTLLLSSASDGLRLCGEDELNVRRRAHESVDTTMSAVSAAAELRSHVCLDVRHGKGGNIESLRLGVRLSVLEEVEHEAARLLRPASLGSVVTLKRNEKK